MTPMSDSTMVVCIDGPMRGKLRAVTGSGKTRFGAYDMPLPPPPPHVGGDYSEIIMPVIYYHVHRLSFLGFDIRVASMHPNTDDIDQYDVITALFNESARQATYRVNND